MNFISVLFALSLTIATLAIPARADEPALLRQLESEPGLEIRSAACAELKKTGTEAAVPCLARLLNDRNLSESARDALESIPGEAATDALLAALPITVGEMKAGIISSLGLRKDSRSVPVLVEYLNDGNEQDEQVAAAAARALGAIGTTDALTALQKKFLNEGAAASLRAQLAQAIIACANELVGAGNIADAKAAFELIRDRGPSDNYRSAAFIGLVWASPAKDQLSLVKHALTAGSGYQESAALQLVRTVNAPGAASEFCGLLPLLRADLQAPFIENLAQRGDPAVVPALMQAAAGTNLPARVAAITVLGALDHGASLPLLAHAAAHSTGEEQRAAREAMLCLRTTHEPFAAAIAGPDAGVNRELARAIGDRGETRLLGKLLELSRDSDPGTRAAYLSAASKLADENDLPAFIKLVAQASTDPRRTEAAETLGATCQRIIAEKGSLDPRPILTAFNAGKLEDRLAFLPVLAGIKHPETAALLSTTALDPNPQLRKAAVMAMATSDDSRLLPELTKTAATGLDTSLRQIAFNAAVRLTTQDDLPTSARIAALEKLMPCAARAEDKRLLLSALAEIPGPQALGMALPLLDNPATKNEAARAILKIAPAIDDAKALASLDRVRGATEDPVRYEAQTLSSNILSRASWIRTWQAAGPYEQPGKNYHALFETPFPPEISVAKAQVQWKPLAATLDPKGPITVDLMKFAPGDSRVAYARAWVFSERDQPAILEIGSDDGIKAWLNEKLVHANNVARPLQAGSDKCPVQLARGWNELLLKITQNNLGWEFCVRVTQPDGAPIRNVRFSATKDVDGAS